MLFFSRVIAEGIVALFPCHTDEFRGQARGCVDGDGQSVGVESARPDHVEDVSNGAARLAFELAVEYLSGGQYHELCIVDGRRLLGSRPARLEFGQVHVSGTEFDLPLVAVVVACTAELLHGVVEARPKAREVRVGRHGAINVEAVTVVPSGREAGAEEKYFLAHWFILRMRSRQLRPARWRAHTSWRSV